MTSQRLAFVDLETTGANPVHDRITEIGIVRVENGEVSRWSTLIDPGCRIPPFIQTLTGITTEMVADAPRFEALADEIQSRLAGCLFVAHNARFDYGFLKNEFKRMGRRFQADVVCTVKLSRRLFPQFHKHSLDSLIERHGLAADDRHRALADAELIWQFWQKLQAQPELDEAVRQQFVRPSLPPHLDAGVLDDLPDQPGVYLFYGEDDVLLYVGKSVNLRQRVLSHFNADTRAFRALRINREIRRIEWRETVGELGALLLESWLIKARQPVHNRALRRNDELCTWQLVEHAAGDFRPRLACGEDLDPTLPRDCFGLFAGKREATQALKKIAEANQLCLATLGLEKTTGAGRPCFGFQLHQCKGACVGKEAIGLHSARLMAALARLKLKTWPYPGPIGVVERDVVSEREDIHVVENWRYLGTAHDEAQLAAILEKRSAPVFDRDTYKLLAKHLGGKVRIVPLNVWPGIGQAPACERRAADLRP
ncbi:ethanolamine utilization protein [Betaproteobacteria bacterium SCN1]|jgi:DNA polymerase-3 subunit epsilon|nr:ethanolamine utilization protein [Betaproteobacteria bacterium SCN1]